MVDKFRYFNNRDNAQCPHCGSLERHRLFSIYLDKQKAHYEKVLHVAPEKCIIPTLTAVTSTYICADINPSRYNWATDIIYADLTALPFTNEFDMIIASHILEHIPDDLSAMANLYKALKPGGLLLAMIPQKLSVATTYEDSTIVTPAERLKHFGQHDHVRWYGSDFTQRLKSVGFYIKVYYTERLTSSVDRMYYDEKHMIASISESTSYGTHGGDLIYECVKL